MTFNEIAIKLKNSDVAARRKSWKDGKSLVWNPRRTLFMLRERTKEGVWYWDGTEEIKEAAEDLSATDWVLV